MPRTDKTIELKFGSGPSLPEGQAPMRYFGDYVLLGEIARGGMGVVYRAQQVRLNRPVALKMIAAGTFAGPLQIQRFRTEARAAASLNHPNLIHIYEVGDCEGLHFLSMELIEGESLAERLRGGPNYPPTEAAALISTLARAIHHAHEHGVLHRDLKPANVLLDKAGEPHIADFGLAKFVDSEEGNTVTGAIFGTPGFMSPEQASGKPSEITTSTDIYSLGAIFYQLLAGRPPFEPTNFAEALAQIKEEHPARPRSVAPGIPTDLETICLKCIEKEPQRRYPSALALAEDLDRWVRHEPIQARPVTDWERFCKWTRRHPLISTLSAAVIVSVLLGAAGVTWQWRRAEVLRQRAEDDRTRLRLQRAEDHFVSDDSRLAVAELAKLMRDQPGNHAPVERLVNAFKQRVFLLPATNASIRFPDPASDITADGTLIANVANDIDIQILEGVSNRLIRTIEHAHEKVIRSLRFTAHGKRIVSGAADGRATLWDLESGKPAMSFTNRSAVYCAELSPDGKTFVAGTADGTVRLWYLVSGSPVQTAIHQPAAVNAARFSPDSQLVLVATADGVVRALHAQTAEPACERTHLGGEPEDARFSGDGQELAVRMEEGEVLTFRFSHRSMPQPSQPFARLENTNFSGVAERLAPLHSGIITFIDRSPNGTRFATACTDKAVRLWDAATLRLTAEPLMHDAVVNCVRFSSDGTRVVTSTAQPTKLRVWDALTGLPLCDWIASEEAVSDVRFSADGGWILASAGWKWPFYISEGSPPEWLPELAEGIVGVRLNSSGMIEPVPVREFYKAQRRLALIGNSSPLERWVHEFLEGER
jgi:hypothetical protein